MKNYLFLILLLSGTYLKAQTVKMTLLNSKEKFPICSTFNPCEGQKVLNIRNKVIDYKYKNEILYITDTMNKTDTFEIRMMGFESICIINYGNTDTIELYPILCWSNYLTIKDRWYKYEYDFYKKLYKHKMDIEYSSDSSFYSQGRLKGMKDRYEPENFIFLEDGKWMTYAKNGDLVMTMNFKFGRFNGSSTLLINDYNLKVKAHHKDGKMVGKWEMNYNGHKYYVYYKDNKIIYDYRKNSIPVASALD